MRAVEGCFARLLADLRTTPPFDTLSGPSWAVLVQLSIRWAEGRPLPSQLELGLRAGCSVRTVQRCLGVLKDAGILCLAGGARADADAALEMGPVLETYLVEFARRLGHGHPPATVARRPATLSRGPATLAGATAATVAGVASRVALANRENPQRIQLGQDRVPPSPEGAAAGLLIKKKELRSSSSKTDALAAAHRALAARHRMAFPDHSVPDRFSPRDLETVVAASEDPGRTVAELDQMHLDAIAGASAKSQRQPPAIAFIWGTREFFLRNAADGRALRVRSLPRASVPAARRPAPQVPSPPSATAAEVLEISRKALELLDAIPSDPLPTRRHASSP